MLEKIFLPKKYRNYLYYFAKLKHISEQEALIFFLERGIMEYEKEKKINLSKAMERLSGGFDYDETKKHGNKKAKSKKI